MELTVRLPQTQSFDIEVDKKHFHSAYANAAKMVFLKQGEHTVSVSEPEPSMLLWGKITRLIKLFSNNSNKHSDDFKFSVTVDTNIVISVEYGNYPHVEFVCDEELSAVFCSSMSSETVTKHN